jgi:hypothetical protein
MNEPITIEFVGRVVEGNDGLEAYFDIEGGIAALEAGCSLFASVDLQNAALTDEDGSCEVFPITEAVTLIAEVTKLRTQLERLQKRAWAVMQEALDSAEVHPCDEHSEDVKARTLAPVYQDLYASLVARTIYVDQGKPGGDMTATATFSREGDKLTLMSIEHSDPQVWAPTITLSLEEARKLYPVQDEPPCRHDWCQSSIHDAPDYCTKCGEDKPEFDDV